MSDPVRTFTVTDQHLQLLRRLVWVWNPMDFGAPAVNPASPYGGTTPIYAVAATLYGDTFTLLDDQGREDFVEDQSNRDRLFEIHDELLDVIKIGIQTGTFRTGTYMMLEGRWVSADMAPEVPL